MRGSEIKPALLTRTEVAWLLGNVKISKTYEYRIKSDIKKKLRTFRESEIPLLIQNGLIDSFDLSKYTQKLMSNTQINNQKGSTSTSNPEIQSQIMVGRKG